MATTISALRAPANITIAVGDTLERVTLPVACKKFSIQSRTNAAKLLWSGTDGAAIGGSAYMTIQPNVIVQVNVSAHGARDLDGQQIYVTSAVGGTVIEIVAED